MENTITINGIEYIAKDNKSVDIEQAFRKTVFDWVIDYISDDYQLTTSEIGDLEYALSEKYGDYSPFELLSEIEQPVYSLIDWANEIAEEMVSKRERVFSFRICRNVEYLINIKANNEDDAREYLNNYDFDCSEAVDRIDDEDFDVTLINENSDSEDYDYDISVF